MLESLTSEGHFDRETTWTTFAHFSRDVKEYSTVLRSLAGEGHPALLSLGGPPVRETPNERGVSQSSRGQIVAMTYTAWGNLEVGMAQAQ